MLNSILPVTQTSKSVKGSYDSMNNNNLFIIDLDTAEYLGLQGMPLELNYDPNSRITAVSSPGRNNPLYIFSGSEDVLEFRLSWFTNDPTKTDVISRCKWLESMTKADGYRGRPHFAKFKWGKLFSESTWIITSAKYTTANFDKQFDYLPTTAIQTVGMRRIVTSNPKIKDIISPIW